MSLKATIVPEMKYKRVGQSKALWNLLKYLQYRDGSIRRDAYIRGDGYGGPERKDYIKPEGRDARWVDRGMGESCGEIAKRAKELEGRIVLARTWVLSPDPDLMAHIPAERRLAVMRQLTERTVEYWYEDNGWGQPEYSYVLHERKTNDNQRQQLHAHIITPGTVPLDEPGSLGRTEHFVRRPHIRNLHRTAADVFELELEHVLGRDRVAEILQKRDERSLAERYPGKDMRDRLKRARQIYDIGSLLKADTQRKEAKKEVQKQRRKAQMKRHELKLYTYHARSEANRRRSEGWDEERIKRAARYEAELAEVRLNDEEWLEKLRRQRQRQVPERKSVMLDYGLEVPEPADERGLSLDLPGLDIPDHEHEES